MNHFHVDEDITKAETLPAAFYRDDEVFEQLKNRVFGRSYQWFGAIDDLLPQESYVKPLMFIEGFLEEPFFLRKDICKWPHLLFKCVYPSWKPHLSS